MKQHSDVTVRTNSAYEDVLSSGSESEDVSVKEKTKPLDPELGDVSIVKIHPDTPHASFFGYALFVTFGVSAWLVLSGIYSQLPFFAATLPEGWSIGVWITMAVQVANVVPLTVAVVQRFRPIDPRLMVAAILAIDLAVCVALTVFWAETITLPFIGTFSVALIGITVIAAISAVSTSVAFYPFVARYIDVYTSALTAGEGLGGMAVGLLALSQSIAKFGGRIGQIWSATMSPSGFFAILTGFIVTAIISYIIILRSSRVTPRPAVDKAAQPLLEVTRASRRRSFRRNVFILVLLAWTNCVENGIVMALIPYATLPYPSGDTVFRLATFASYIVDPFVCMLPAVKKGAWSERGRFWRILAAPITGTASIFRSVPLLAHASIYSVAMAYIVISAMMSPAPPLSTSNPILGSFLIIFAKQMCRVPLAYVKTVCWLRLHSGSDRKARLAMSVAGGVATQVGAGVGALGVFIMDHFVHLFGTGVL